MPTSISQYNQGIAFSLSNNFPRLLSEFTRDFESRIWRELTARGYDGIRPAHSAVFASLGMGSVRVAKLAEQAQVTQQAMGKMLKELERLGYIARDIDSDDKRAKEIRLTERGKALTADCIDTVQQVQNYYAEIVGEQLMNDLEANLRNALGKLELQNLPPQWQEPAASSAR
jgi:DNA-binding MarR family transcriptional regulator